MASVTTARESRADVLHPRQADAELVARALGGDRWAEEALYRRHVGDATRIATFLMRRHADADDVVQDAFVTAFGRLRELRDPNAFGGWLGRIVTNQARGRLRRRGLMRRLGLDRGEDDAALPELASRDASPEQRTELAALDRVLGALPTDARVAWVLRHVEGMQLEEVAAALDVSLATAKRKIKSADDAIRARFGHAIGAVDESEEEER